MPTSARGQQQSTCLASTILPDESMVLPEATAGMLDEATRRRRRSLISAVIPEESVVIAQAPAGGLESVVIGEATVEADQVTPLESAVIASEVPELRRQAAAADSVAMEESVIIPAGEGLLAALVSPSVPSQLSPGKASAQPDGAPWSFPHLVHQEVAQPVMAFAAHSGMLSATGGHQPPVLQGAVPLPQTSARGPCTWQRSLSPSQRSWQPVIHCTSFGQGPGQSSSFVPLTVSHCALRGRSPLTLRGNRGSSLVPSNMQAIPRSTASHEPISTPTWPRGGACRSTSPVVATPETARSAIGPADWVQLAAQSSLPVMRQFSGRSPSPKNFRSTGAPPPSAKGSLPVTLHEASAFRVPSQRWRQGRGGA